MHWEKSNKRKEVCQTCISDKNIAGSKSSLPLMNSTNMYKINKVARHLIQPLKKWAHSNIDVNMFFYSQWIKQADISAYLKITRFIQ